jgi:arsenate reductase
VLHVTSAPDPARPQPRTKVLFLCSGNSARSQMAEALLRHLAGDRFEVYSAGLDPKPIHPLTREVLAEAGIDMRGQRSKTLSEYLGRLSVRHAIIVCDAAADRCPALYPFAVDVHRWPFDDPAGWPGGPQAQRAKFREVRDALRARLELFVAAEDARAARGGPAAT